MIPLEVPITMLSVTARQVTRPKFRAPASEYIWDEILRSLCHLTTSHGAEDSSGSNVGGWLLLAYEEFLECGARKAGELARGLCREYEDSREWKRRSKRRVRPTGLLRGKGL